MSYYVLRRREGELWRVDGQHLDSRKAQDEFARRRGEDPDYQYSIAPEDVMTADRELALALRLWRKGRS